MNGSHQEPLPILTVAKELNIDAVNAFIYWSTGHAVECARLNGKQRRTYYPAELFSGKQGIYIIVNTLQNLYFWLCFTSSFISFLQHIFYNSFWKVLKIFNQTALSKNIWKCVFNIIETIAYFLKACISLFYLSRLYSLTIHFYLLNY